jgi:hypothetical protein
VFSKTAAKNLPLLSADISSSVEEERFEEKQARRRVVT